jgi:hypothetical protein
VQQKISSFMSGGRGKGGGATAAAAAAPEAWEDF